jgi:hypothetical protein
MRRNHVFRLDEDVPTPLGTVTMIQNAEHPAGRQRAALQAFPLRQPVERYDNVAIGKPGILERPTRRHAHDRVAICGNLEDLEAPSLGAATALGAACIQPATHR